MSDWTALHNDLLVSIAEKVDLIDDLVVFGSVCKSWNEVFKNNKKHPRRQIQIPWLMLPAKEEDDHRQIYSLTKEKVLKNNLYVPESSDEMCIGLNYGWILTISPRDGQINLVHPLSRSVIELPPQTLIHKTYNFFSIRAALSGNPSESSDFVLMTSGDRYLDYWRRGDEDWTRIEMIIFVYDLTYHRDQFYVIVSDGTIFGCKVSGCDDPVVPCAIIELNLSPVSYCTPYIVGYVDTLLIVTAWYEAYDPYDHRPVKIWVSELDLGKNNCKKINRLNDKAIFVGVTLQ